MPENAVVEKLIAEADQILHSYQAEYKGLSWREKVLHLVELASKVKKLAIRSNPHAAQIGARERIRLYLTEHAGIVIDAAELAVVSGISEYGRRIRELRVQDGFKILTGHSNDPELGLSLGPAEYLLIEAEPDHTAAHRWHIANRIRREKDGGSSGRILRFLLENVGQKVTSEELAYVAKASEFGRRIRELRTEQGYAISTKSTGRPDLKMGEYILESDERIAEPHDRNISTETEKFVYERANNTCQLCSWNRDKWTKSDPRILEVHHIEAHVAGGRNSADNLALLCSRCHDDVHANRKKLPKDING
jgi:5-methylcytosine-specific restriction endonuclease McrA